MPDRKNIPVRKDIHRLIATYATMAGMPLSSLTDLILEKEMENRGIYYGADGELVMDEDKLREDRILPTRSK